MNIKFVTPYEDSLVRKPHKGDSCANKVMGYIVHHTVLGK